MDFQTAYTLVQKLGKHLNDAFSLSQQSEIEMLYKEVFCKPLKECNCKDRHTDAVVEMYNYLKINGKMKEKCNYRLKAGVIIQPTGTSEVYTNDNLTDKVAADFLDERPGAVGMFEFVPEEAKIELDEDVIDVFVEAIQSGMTQKAIKEKYKGATIGDVELPTAKIVDIYIKAASDRIDAEKDK